MQTDARELRGQVIAQIEGQITRLDEHAYRVKSQSGNGEYEILSTEIGWVCSCADSIFRGAKCKHLWAIKYSIALERALLKGYQLFHNYIRQHEGLQGKTPAEACGIKIAGQNKWITLIQNAKLNSPNGERSREQI